MDGACEAMLIPARKSPVALHFQPGEKLCGFARVVKRKATVSPPERRILSPGNSSGEAQTRLSPTALSNPCSADCRGCISFTFNSNRFRTAVATDQARGRQTGGRDFTQIPLNLVRQRSALYRLSSPRAPPGSPAGLRVAG